MAAKKKKKGSVVDPNNKLIAENRKAKRNYEFEDFIEAGLVLVGTEVKSCRAGKVQLGEAFIDIRNGEAFLKNAHIAEYTQQGAYLNHDPSRLRKVLLSRKELDRLAARLNEKGESAVPVKMYLKRGFIKLQIGIGKGRKNYDKRENVKARESDREMQRALKSKRRF